MAVRIRNSNGTWRDATAVRIRNSNGTWRFAQTIRKRLSNGTWSVVWSALSAAPNPCVGAASGFAPSGFVTSQNCVVSGFSGAVSWARISGSTAHNINNASGTTVSWSGTVPGNTTSVWRVTNAGTTFDVTVQLNWVNLS